MRKKHVHEASPAAGSQAPMKREYSGDRTRCRVTFWLPQAAARAPRRSRWRGASTTGRGSAPDGAAGERRFHLELELEAGREHEFRFVVDGVRWENAWNADRYVWSDHAQCENSVIVL